MGHLFGLSAQQYYNIENEDESDARVAPIYPTPDRGTLATKGGCAFTGHGGGAAGGRIVAPNNKREGRTAATQRSGATPTTMKRDKEDGEEQEEEDPSEDTEDSERLVDTLNLLQRHELLSLFSENLKSGRAVMKHFVHASMWVKSSNFNKINSHAASSSGTSGRLFTGLQTLLIEEAIWSLPPNASGQKCVDAITSEERCREQCIHDSFTAQQLKVKVKTIRWKAAREAKSFHL
ncbi:Hypothetical predicted protein [Paramuricea clavata]|uniref:Uncharacterized protein n=1 Tax=Paramuricea clavata TaxID=317549 RepID=A0A6S7GHE7_PARCT|nr:Hypothetical predicted protein [Paramuricea clavata]